MEQPNKAIDTLARRNRRPSRKKRTRRKTALAFYVLLSLFVIAGAVLIARLAGYRAARDEYAAYQMIQAEAVASAETAEPEQAAARAETAAPALAAAPTARPFASARVASLQKENRDTVGWLDIPGTGIQYPIVQGADNEYYMTRTFQKKKNASGAIFVDCWNAPDFSDFNTVIYGHNMKDGSMFAGLREYRRQAFLDAHPYVEITLLNSKLRYRVFAAYTSQGEAGADFRGQTCNTETQRAEFIRAARKRSAEVDSSQAVSRHDRLLTLVTCTGGTYEWYWVVHAVLVEEEG